MHLRHLTIYCKHAEAFRSLSLSDLLHTQHVQQQLGQEADGSRHAVVQAVSFLSHILLMAPPVSRPAPSNHTGASRITG